MPIHGKIENIHKVQVSISVISNLMANDELDSLRFDAPPMEVTKERNIPLISFSIAALLALGAVGVNVYYDITPKLSMLLLLIFIICAGIIVMLVHLKFKSSGATVIVTVVLIAVLAIGFDILLAKEVVELATKFAS